LIILFSLSTSSINLEISISEVFLLSINSLLWLRIYSNFSSWSSLYLDSSSYSFLSFLKTLSSAKSVSY
jgi:hypothetical protein